MKMKNPTCEKKKIKAKLQKLEPRTPFLTPSPWLLRPGSIAQPDPNDQTIAA